MAMVTLDEVATELRRVTAQLEEIKHRLPPSLGSIRDAAKILQCDPSTVYRAYKRGEVSGRQIGGRIFIDLAALGPATHEQAVNAAWSGAR